MLRHARQAAQLEELLASADAAQAQLKEHTARLEVQLQEADKQVGGWECSPVDSTRKLLQWVRAEALVVDHCVYPLATSPQWLALSLSRHNADPTVAWRCWAMQ